MKKILAISLVVLFMSQMLIGCSIFGNKTDNDVTPKTTVTPQTTAHSITSAVAKVKPSVVRVKMNDGMGSGFVVDKAGYILTNSHVVEDSKTVTVVFDNTREVNASVIARDEIVDLAILRVFGESLVAVNFAQSNEIMQGQDVIAIGYPLDLEGSVSVSRGIISAFRTDNGVNYIQTDAALNPGNSGGPLINLDGEVLGVNVMGIKVAGQQIIEGMNFAIIASSALPVIPKLMAGESNLKPIPTITIKQETWLTYTSVNYRYTIQYPNTWKLSVDTLITGKIIIQSSASASISIMPPFYFREGDSISNLVDLIINSNKSQLVYRLVSRTDLKWQGVYSACKWEILHQSSANYPLLYDKQLYLLSDNNYFYQVSGSVKESEYNLYSNLIDNIIASFRVTP